MNIGWKTALTIGAIALTAQTAAAQEPTNPTTSDAAFRDRNPGPWRTVLDPVTHNPEFVYGGRFAPPVLPREAADFEFAARLVVDANPELFGLASRDLELIAIKELNLSRVGSSDKVAAVFRQSIDGIGVFNGTVTVLFERHTGAVLALETEAVPGAHEVSLVPAASSDDVLPAANAAYIAEFGVAPTQVDSIDAVIVGPSVFFGYKNPIHDMGPTLAYSIELSSPGYISTHGVPAMGRVLVSAEGDHTVFHVGSRSFSIDGKVETNVNTSFEPNTASNQEVARLKYAYVRNGTQSGPILATTDVNGDYNFPQAGPLTLVVEYEGPFCRTNDTSGGEHFISIPGASGSNVDFLLNPTLAEFDTAEAAAFYWVNEFHDYIVGVDPTDSTMDFAVTANVNLNDLLCNAYFNGNSINLERAGSGCTNTSYQDVVQHEEGHFANQLYVNGGITGAFHEGNADNFAYYINDDPCLTSFGGNPNSCLRHANQTSVQKCPTDGDESCNGGASHTEGQALASAVYEVRERLNNTLGNTVGDATADALFMAWMNAFNDGQILNVIRDHWLALDDDNGDLSDFTPHFTEIDGGFQFYGWDPIPDLNLGLVASPVSNAEIADMQAVPVVATISSLSGATVTADVRYRVNGGGFQTVAMAPTGNPNEFAASIPGVMSPSTIEWYLTATSGTGDTQAVPATAPNTTDLYHVGKLMVFGQWNFDGATDEGWTHVNLSGQNGDQFERGNPANSNESTDPSAAFSGNNVWGTDLSLQGFDGKYEPNGSGELRSPIMNLSGTSEVKLQFRRWLNVEEAIFDQAQVRVNNTVVYQNPQNGHTLDDDWGVFNIDISAQAAGNPLTRIDWRLTSDGGLEFGGWNIDDVMLYRVDPNPAAFFAAYGAGCVGASGNTPALTGTGVPSPGNSISIDVTGGKPSGVGLLAASGSQVSVPVGGGCTLLVGAIAGGGFPIALDANGDFGAAGALPAAITPADVYWQFFGDDSGLVASNGLQMHVQ